MNINGVKTAYYERYEALTGKTQSNEEKLKSLQTFELSIMDAELPTKLINLLFKLNKILIGCDDNTHAHFVHDFIAVPASAAILR